jgi:hypothetical protein
MEETSPLPTGEQWGSAHDKLLAAVDAIETPLRMVIDREAPGRLDVPEGRLEHVITELAHEVREAIDGDTHKLALRLLQLEQLSIVLSEA